MFAAMTTHFTDMKRGTIKDDQALISKEIN